MNYYELRNQIDKDFYQNNADDSEESSDDSSGEESYSSDDSSSYEEGKHNNSSAESEDTIVKRFEKFTNMKSSLGVAYPTISLLKDNPEDLGKYEPLAANDTYGDEMESKKLDSVEVHEKADDRELKLNFHNSSEVRDYIVGIDSTFKENLTSTTSEVVWEFDPPIKNIIKLEVESIEFPNTFYSFSSAKGNTKLIIDSSTITIDDGNYDISGIISYINSAIVVAGIVDVSFGYNTYSQRVYANVSGTHTINFGVGTFSDRIDDWGLGYYLGFRTKQFTNVSSRITATSPPNMVVDTYVILKIDDYSNFHQPTWHNNEIGFCKIQLQVPKGQVQYLNTAYLFSKFNVFSLPTTINKWDIRILDKYGQLIELADSKFSFSIKMTQINNSKIHESYRKTLLKE